MTYKFHCLPFQTKITLFPKCDLHVFPYFVILFNPLCFYLIQFYSFFKVQFQCYFIHKLFAFFHM